MQNKLNCKSAKAICQHKRLYLSYLFRTSDMPVEGTSVRKCKENCTFLCISLTYSYLCQRNDLQQIAASYMNRRTKNRNKITKEQ